MTSPTIVAKPDFDATAEAETLAEAIESIWSKDARTITSCLSGCSNEQRQQIAAYFAETMHQSLFEKLDEVTVGNMGRLVAALLDPPVNFLCKELHDALTEQKVDNGVLVEILCTKSGSEMKQITETYQALFNHTLVEDVGAKTSGHFRTLLTLVLSGERIESGKCDINDARENAEYLAAGDNTKLGMDEESFCTVLATDGFEQLRRVFDEYQKLSKQTMHQGIRYSMSGGIVRAMLAIVEYIESPPEFFARRLYLAMNGIGTYDRTLIRIVVSRSEIDLGDIKSEYKWIYGRSLYDAVESETFGNYNSAICAIIGKD